jgi:hypothetical protein
MTVVISHKLITRSIIAVSLFIIPNHPLWSIEIDAPNRQANLPPF